MPNRIIKESVCTSDTLDGLTWFQECFFYRLIVSCDDYGRIDARPPILRSRLFPLKNGVTNANIAEALESLRAAGLVDLYEVDGRPYLQLRTWSKHQQIRAKKSKYPAPYDTVKSSDINRNQVKSNVPVIQSESNPNPIRIQNPNPNRTRADGDVVADPLVQAHASQDMDAVLAKWKRTGGREDGETYDTIDALLKEHSVDDICEAIGIAHKNGAGGKWSYVTKVLENWKEHGKRDKPVQSGRGNTGDTMQRHAYTDDDFKGMMIDLDAEDGDGL